MADLTNIDSKIFTAREFRLESGQSLPVLELAYETYGTRSLTEENAVLVVHGYTSSHHAAGRNAKGKQGRGVTEGAPGWFDALIGPGKAVDTRSLFRDLGECSRLRAWQQRTEHHRSTHQEAVRTDLPDISMRDMVAEPEAAGRFARSETAGRSDRPVDGRLPVLPVGRVISRIS